MHSKTKKTVGAALFAALVYIATSAVIIPSPLKGYLNFGDCAVLLAGWMLSPGYGFLAAGLGSALADLFAGYVTYAPVTFVIKGAMALVVFACHGLLREKLGKLPSQIIGAILAEVLMVCGYYVFEGFLYGFVPSLVNIPSNAVQGIVAIVAGVILIKVFEKAKLENLFKR